VERICPFLALGDDHRTVIDGYDPDHLCHARTPPAPVDRAFQAEACLAEAHRQCEFYLAYVADRDAALPPMPAPAPDTHLARTRLVLAADARRAAAVNGAYAWSPGRWVIAAGIAAVGVAAAATAAAGGFGPLSGADPSPSSRASLPVNLPVVDTPTPQPTATEAPSAPASSSSTPTPRPSRLPASSSAPATPKPQTYVVQPGDTLSIIASQFGVSVSAIQEANGISDPDEIVPGQVLVIP
jgi:LysM repeat protein